MTYWDKEFYVHPVEEPIASSNGTHKQPQPAGAAYVPVSIRVVQPKWWGCIVHKGTILVRLPGVTE